MRHPRWTNCSMWWSHLIYKQRLMMTGIRLTTLSLLKCNLEEGIIAYSTFSILSFWPCHSPMLLSSSPEAALGQPKSASPGAAFSKQQLEMVIDNTLSIEEHKGLWKEILSEMMLMVGLQYLMLLIPFFVTGTRSIFFNHFLYLSALNFCHSPAELDIFQVWNV